MHCNVLQKKRPKSLINMFLVSDFLTFSLEWCIFRLFIDLRTFVAKSLCPDLRTFSADFFVTEKQTPQTFSLLECMGLTNLVAKYLFLE